jgi:hypothetical protein
MVPQAQNGTNGQNEKGKKLTAFLADTNAQIVVFQSNHSFVSLIGQTGEPSARNRSSLQLTFPSWLAITLLTSFSVISANG